MHCEELAVAVEDRDCARRSYINPQNNVAVYGCINKSVNGDTGEATSVLRAILEFYSLGKAKWMVEPAAGFPQIDAPEAPPAHGATVAHVVERLRGNILARQFQWVIEKFDPFLLLPAENDLFGSTTDGRSPPAAPEPKPGLERFAVC